MHLIDGADVNHIDVLVLGDGLVALVSLLYVVELLEGLGILDISSGHSHHTMLTLRQTRYGRCEVVADEARAHNSPSGGWRFHSYTHNLARGSALGWQNKSFLLQTV